ncbi:MAG TPA: phage tail tape measure protein [Nitratidesulfovibrio sp.]|nr:phage tail tape measure protein [Nitratidesulfovibrio sp.]
MGTKLERLEFAIGLKDQASGKLGQLRSSLDKLTDGVSHQFGKARDGVLGAVATGYSIHQMVAPAIDLNRALGEVSSLGRADTGLAMLQAEAQKFAMAYGGSAAEVIRAGYEIQSAIDGLTDKELARFTTASGVLAKASKADVETMTSYMGTMYGIFKNTADGMGKSRWVEEIAGQTAYAVGLFKSSGPEMSAAFTALGANATAAGRSAAEQMAILGTLQATMSGSESGTKYKAFLAGVGTAQKELGLTFTDTQGNMLGMVDILDKIQGKFGDTLSVAESDQLKKAFGSDEAVSLIKQLMMDTDGLKANMANIANIKGMDNVTSMAAKMTDIWGRLGGTVNVLAGSFGQKLLPPLEEIVGKGVAVLQTLIRWIDLAPNLARWVGYGAIVVMSLATVMGIFTAVVAVNRIALMALGGPLKLVAFTFGLLTKLTGLQTAAQWLLNSALLANPMTWVVLGVLSLIAVLGDALGWWDNLKAALGDTAWGNALIETVLAVIAPFRVLYKAIEGVWSMLGFGGGDKAVQVAATGAPQAAIESTATALTTAQPIGPLSSLEAARTPAIPAGGLLQATTNQINKGRTRQTTIGSVTINADQPMTPGQLDEWAALQAG